MKPLPGPDLTATEIPSGMDRGAFMMRSAVVGAAAVITGRSASTLNAAQAQAPAVPPLSPDLGGPAVSVTLC